MTHDRRTNGTAHAPALRQAALVATLKCAAQIERRAGALCTALAGARMDEDLRATALTLSERLKAIARSVPVEIGALQVRLDELAADPETVVGSLSGIDATFMGVLAGLTDVVEKLEAAAELDPRGEPAYITVVEAVGAMLHAFQAAKDATQALRSTMNS